MKYLDLRIIENLEEVKLPELPEPVNSKFCYSEIILVLVGNSGKAKFNIRANDYILAPNSFLSIAPGTPFLYKERSDDFDANVIIFTESLLNKVARGLISNYFTQVLYEHPLQSITPRKAEMFHIIFDYLTELVHEKENYFYKQIVKNYLEILFYEGCNQMLQEKGNREEDAYKDSRRDKISQNFLALVEKDIKGNRKVEYYATKLNLSPKYMSFVVKDCTGKTPSEWINEYTLSEARLMLRDFNNTIQSISYDLGFATPSHFGKFFKEKTGMTPKEYRKNGSRVLDFSSTGSGV